MPNRQRARLNSFLPQPLNTAGPSRIEEVWVCHGADGNLGFEKFLDDVKRVYSPSTVRVIDHDSAPRVDQAGRSAVASDSKALGGLDLERKLAEELFVSTADSILIIDADSTIALGYPPTDKQGRQILVVSNSKRDRAEAHTRLFGSQTKLRAELAFVPRPLMVRPAIFREIFDNDTARLKEWSTMWISESSKPDIGQLYGAWIWTNKPHLVQLVGESTLG